MLTRLSALAALVSGLLFSFNLPAYATSYTTYITSSDNQGNVLNYGLTDSGTVVLETSASVSGPIFSSFTPPSTFQSYGTTPPSLAYDNGSPCTLSLPGIFTQVTQSRCNNGFEVFEASLNNGNGSGLFTGSDPVADLLYSIGHHDFDNILLNAVGDIAAVGAGAAPSGGDRNFLFVASTPEPASFALLGTGLLSIAGILRRRTSTQS